MGSLTERPWGSSHRAAAGEGLQGLSCAHLVRDLVRAVLLLLLWVIGGEAARLTHGVSSVTSVVSGSGGCVVTGRAAYVYVSSAMFVDTGLAVFGDRGLLSASMFSGNGEGVVSLIPNVETRPRPPEADLWAGLPPDSPSRSLTPGKLRCLWGRCG